MPVIILHPTEELKLIKLQKELVFELFNKKRILYRTTPLWIELSDLDIQNKNDLNQTAEKISGVTLCELQVSEKNIFINVKVLCDKKEITAKLPLVNILKGEVFSKEDINLIQKKNQPVKQLKVFRLGIEKELSSNSKCITDCKWIKIR